jgi:hypothetical protein
VFIVFLDTATGDPHALFALLVHHLKAVAKPAVKRVLTALWRVSWVWVLLASSLCTLGNRKKWPVPNPANLPGAV